MHIKLLIQNNYTMKHLFTLLALTFLAGSAFAQEARYDDFKTGTFTYESQEGEVEIKLNDCLGNLDIWTTWCTSILHLIRSQPCLGN